jgi:hypothetical protein
VREIGETDHGFQHAYHVRCAGIALQTRSTFRLNQPFNNTSTFNRIMAPSRPRVITDLSLPDLVQHLLDNDSPSSVLVVCASKNVFIEQLHATCLDSGVDNTNDEQTINMIEPESNEPSKPGLHPLLNQPTLHQLATSRKIKLVFCPELVHLRAYLSTLAIPPTLQPQKNQITENNKPKASLLTILNPINQHRATSSFSAQGLNRTFALAVEAAHATQTQLLMVECPLFLRPRDNTESLGDAGYDFDFEPDTAAVQPQPPSAANPWDEEVSILNVTTKSFGAGGRGWVGRTVTVRRVAERWFVFSAFRRGEILG